MKNLIYFLEYVVIRVVDLFFQLWPRQMALWIGERLGLCMSVVLRKRKKLVVSNLTASFPEKSAPEINEMATEFWKNLGRVAVEFIRLTDLNGGNFRDYFEVEGEEILVNARNQNKGIILIGLHFTNWEYCGLGIQHIYGWLVAIARPMKNPWVQKWILRKRHLGQMDIILHREAVKGSLKALKQKKSVGILVDQNLYTGGEFVQFFGRPAATTTLPALLESRTGAPVLISYLLRDKNNKFKLVFEPPILFPVTKSENWLQERTQIISDRVEAAIRRRPEHWFWIHNRWKRTPPVKDIKQ